MRRRPRLLDLFCGAGGAAKGYQRAGFHVTGVDLNPQPRYCGEVFHHADALQFLRRHCHEFDAIHASPPCQAYSAMKSLPQAKEHPRLIEPVRRLLRASGKLYVIENVPGAPMRDPFCLCGSMFGLKSSRGYLRRHRLFESNFPIGSLPKCNHVGLAIGVYGHGSGGLLGMRMRTANVDEARILMDMDWTTRDGMSQAIPPAYTEYVGRALALALQPGMKAAA